MTNSKNTTTKDNALRQVRIVIDRLVRDGKAVACSDSSVHELFPIATSLAEGQALRDWVTKEKATHTIEVGLGYGVSALFICEGLLINGDKNARHVVLDPHQATRYKDCGLQFLEEAGVAHLVEYHAEESQIALPSFLSKDRHFDLAFIDGSHLFDAVFLDLIYSGHADLAWKFYDQAWPPRLKNKKQLFEDFRAELETSPYRSEVKVLVEK